MRPDRRKKIVPQTDSFLYDDKHTDYKKHHRFTGRASHNILENRNRPSRLETSIVVGVPIVPGFNDSEKDLKSIVD